MGGSGEQGRDLLIWRGRSTVTMLPGRIPWAGRAFCGWSSHPAYFIEAWGVVACPRATIMEGDEDLCPPKAGGAVSRALALPTGDTMTMPIAANRHLLSTYWRQETCVSVYHLT